MRKGDRNVMLSSSKFLEETFRDFMIDFLVDHTKGAPFSKTCFFGTELQLLEL